MTNKEYVVKYADDVIRSIPGFPKEGIIFKDVVPVFENPEYAQKVIDAFVDEIKENNIEFDRILVPESRGFLFGVPLSLALNKPLALARKPGKLPLPGISVDYDLEYGKATLVISKDTIKAGDKVLILDDLLATGGSAEALSRIVKLAGACVASYLFYIELTPLKGRIKLKDYPVHTLVKIEAY